MGKVLSTKEFNALKAKADSFDTIVSTVVGANEGMTAEEVTPEFIQEAMIGNEGNTDVLSAAITTLEGNVETLNTTITELEGTVATGVDTMASLTTERDNLKSQIDAIEKSAGAASVTTQKPAAEGTASVQDDLLAFSNAHKGDTLAIAAKMVELGLA